jgi:hypothetical protein
LRMQTLIAAGLTAGSGRVGGDQLSGQGGAGLKIGFGPVPEGVVCPAAFDVRPVIYADVMPLWLFMLQKRELPRTAAADVDDHVAS